MASCSNPCLRKPSQKGLFFYCPQRQSVITSLPAKSQAVPFLSTNIISPSILNEPLLSTFIVVATSFYKRAKVGHKEKPVLNIKAADDKM